MQTVIRSSFDYRHIFTSTRTSYYYSHYPLPTGCKITIFWAFSQLDKVIRHANVARITDIKFLHVLLTISNLSFHRRPLHSAGRFLLPARTRNGGCNALSALSLFAIGVATQCLRNGIKSRALQHRSIIHSTTLKAYSNQLFQQFQHDF